MNTHTQNGDLHQLFSCLEGKESNLKANACLCLTLWRLIIILNIRKSFPTLHNTHSEWIIGNKRVLLFKYVVAAYCKQPTQLVLTLCRQHWKHLNVILDDKVKGKVVPVCAMKSYKGSRCIGSLILNFVDWGERSSSQILHWLGESLKPRSGYRYFDKRCVEEVWSGIQHDPKESVWPCWYRLQDTGSAVFPRDIMWQRN